MIIVSRRFFLFDGFIYLDLLILGVIWLSGIVGLIGMNDDIEEDNDKGFWGVLKVYELVGMVMLVG